MQQPLRSRFLKDIHPAHSLHPLWDLHVHAFIHLWHTRDTAVKRVTHLLGLVGARTKKNVAPEDPPRVSLLSPFDSYRYLFQLLSPYPVLRRLR